MKNMKKIHMLLLGTLMMTGLIATCGREGPDTPPDLTPPLVSSTSPFYLEQDVPINTSVTIKFSELMNSASLTGKSFMLQQGNVGVSGSVSCNGSRAAFKPDANLAPNSTYNVLIGVEVKDLAGNTMTAPYLYSFTTGTRVTVNTHTLTVAPAENGGITPGGPLSVNDGEIRSFTLAPDSGYHIGPVSGCGGTLSGSTFTTAPIKADCTVTATFAADGAASHTVTALVTDGSGSITPGSATVSDGEKASFTVTPAANYHIDSVSGCGGKLSGAIYTTGAVKADCTVSAGFAIDAPETHTVTARVSGGNGTIAPGSDTVSDGGHTFFVLTPDANYHIASVSGCGGTLSGTTYTTGAVTSDCTVTASFAMNAVERHTVLAIVDGDGGTINPPGFVLVEHGKSITFEINPDRRYRLVAPVGGDCGGQLNGDDDDDRLQYTTNPIMADCTVRVSFSRIESMVMPLAGEHGTLIPDTPQLVYFEEVTNFTVVPDPYFTIASVTGCNGTLLGDQFTTGPVIADCTVAATFVGSGVSFTVTPVSEGNGIIVPGSPQPVEYNSTFPFTVTPDANYHIASVSGCSGTLSGTTYTTGAITADCTITASFARLLTVTPMSDPNGAISPADPQPVEYNKIAIFTITPANGYSIASVTGCGGSLVDNVYTTAPVTEDCTITAVFNQSYAI